jgi:hypothetical protein
MHRSLADVSLYLPEMGVWYSRQVQADESKGMGIQFEATISVPELGATDEDCHRTVHYATEAPCLQYQVVVGGVMLNQEHWSRTGALRSVRLSS